MSNETDNVPSDLILGMAQGYSFEQLRPFVASLKQTGYSGETVFFGHHLDADTEAHLRAWGVEVIPFSNCRSRSNGPFVRASFDNLARLYYHFRWPFFRQGWLTLLSATKQRYHLYLEFLMRNQDRFQRVLLADVRDIFFQGNPFEDHPEPDLIFFEEDPRELLGKGNYNPRWIRALLGPSTLQRLENKVTSCSGTIMGQSGALIYYLQKYVALMQEAENLHMTSGDQAIHNAVVYEHLGEAPFSVSVVPNDRGPVYTMGTIPRGQIRISTGHEVVFPDGRMAPVLHQYDRFPDITAMLLQKTRQAVPPGDAISNGRKRSLS